METYNLLSVETSPTVCACVDDLDCSKLLSFLSNPPSLTQYTICFRYFFLEFEKPEEAANAVKTGNGYKLDKSHIFAVNFFSDFEKYKNLPDNWTPPKKTEFKEFVSRVDCSRCLSGSMFHYQWYWV